MSFNDDQASTSVQPAVVVSTEPAQAVFAAAVPVVASNQVSKSESDEEVDQHRMFTCRQHLTQTTKHFNRWQQQQLQVAEAVKAALAAALPISSASGVMAEGGSCRTFRGKRSEDVNKFINELEWSFQLSKAETDKVKVALLVGALRDTAKEWVYGINLGKPGADGTLVGAGPGLITTYEGLKEALIERFPRQDDEWEDFSAVFGAKQSSGQSVDDFLENIEKHAAAGKIADSQVVKAAVQGLKPEIKKFVRSRDVETLAELKKWARRAEQLELEEGPGVETNKIIRAMEASLDRRLDQLNIRGVGDVTPALPSAVQSNGGLSSRSSSTVEKRIKQRNWTVTTNRSR